MEKRKKQFFSRFFWHGILASSHFSANTGKVMPWTETTVSITRNDILAALIDSAISTLKGNLLRLCVPGFSFSVSILLGSFDLLLLPTSFLAVLAS